MNNNATYTANITVNGTAAVVTVEPNFLPKFGGVDHYARPTYTVHVAHGKYSDHIGNYSNKALAINHAIVDATAFLAKIYPVAIAVTTAAPIETETDDLLAILFKEVA